MARAAAQAVVERLGERVVSAYVIGSLAHGGFAPAVSDIDIAVLVGASTPADGAAIADVVAEVQRGLDSPLAERISVFHGDWGTFAAPPPTARLPAIDRLDLMAHGVLVSGADLRACAGRVPDHAELVEATAAFLAANPLPEHDPAALVDAGPRPLTKAILFPVRFLYTHATGRADGNAGAADWYCDARRPAALLVRAAMAWRSGVVAREEAIALVSAHLRGLQAECTAAFAAGH